MSFVFLNHGVICVHDQKVVCTLSLREWDSLAHPLVPSDSEWLPRWLKGHYTGDDYDEPIKRRQNGRPRN
jgi:hypothetical protein